MECHGSSARVVRLALVLAALVGPRAFAQTPGPGPSRAVVRVPRNDGLTPDNLARLAGSSATARDLLARLESVPDATFLVRAHPRLVADERLLGRGRFWVVRGHLYGVLEYQAEPAGSHRALRVLAHELAHALELGMLPREPDTRALESRLRVKELDDRFDPAPGIETDFARAISYRVHRELRARDRTPSDLLAQAARAGIALPPEALELSHATR